MYQSSCWGIDSWWIIILFAILLIWLCNSGNQCGCGSNQCGYGSNTLDCCNGCCH
ncbi:MAG: hypothetical protein Q4A63_06340 [Butyricicoccus pullicaecorum]|nr:hypothetical protein [Butyricicoccus pullicaecorum]MDO4669418.1 hypothetical protein [Butyricicoccus pullicaecorum]